METSARSGGRAEPPPIVRFGGFKLDLRAGELCKEGRRIRLQEQPFRILQMLIESPGEVISREAIRNRLWPDNTVVEFDHSINAAVKRLRDALRDSSDKPRYVETVARRGYRFIGDIKPPTDDPVAAQPTTPPLTAEQSNGHRAMTILPPERTAPRHPSWFTPRLWIPAGLVTAVLSVWVGIDVSRPDAKAVATHLEPLMRLDVDLGAEMPPSSEPGTSAILSPDARRLVYLSGSKLFKRELDQSNTSELKGTEDALAPFFSPDGEWVGFFSRGTLKKVSMKGGSTVLGDCPLANGGSWADDGSIVVTCNLALMRLSSRGGPLLPVTELAPGEIVHRWPQVLPGSKAVLFTAFPSFSGSEGSSIQVLSLADRRRKTLMRGATWARYLPTGHLIYFEKGTLFAVAFDPGRLEVRGSPTPILKEIAYSAAWGSAQIDVSLTGTLVYRNSRSGEGLVTVQWLDSAGNTRPLLPVPGNYLSPTLSPDSTRLALTSAGDIWVYELGHGSMTRLTVGGGYGNPLWSVDGRYIVFRAARSMLWTRADGSAQPQGLTQSSNQQTPWSFTPDGKRLAFAEIDPTTGADLWTVPVETSPSGLRAGKPEAFLRTPFHERAPMLSPDGHWLAYQSNESGTYQIYVTSFPQNRGKRQVSTASGTFQSWSRNGRELFYLTLGTQRQLADRQLMAVSYKVHGDSFLPDAPRVYSNKIVAFGTTRSYEPAPDGSIVALTAADTPNGPRNRTVFLLNFFDELRRRIPAGPN